MKASELFQEELSSNATVQSDTLTWIPAPLVLFDDPGRISLPLPCGFLTSVMRLIVARYFLGLFGIKENAQRKP